ncbi:xylulokinase [Paractinoplanes globisporus]|uniref:Xylulokinase n=1 Tax=Paractinoplanes globisporus TaxID=113565 RepID=A0ABW6W7V7_9ACTN|nr:FGGY family carbohydrate kinase [Actinoplanes globisporus]
MPQTTTLLGVDLGTSSVKAVVARLDGTVVAQARRDYPVSHPRPGWSETSASDWLDASAAAVRAAVAQAGSQPDAIGLSGQMHGVVLATENGRAVRPAVVWSDARAVDQVEQYDDLPEQLLTRLANPLSPGMAGPLLAWLTIHEAATYRAARWALQPKDWLRAQLTGLFATEPSDASATLLYDISGDTWDTELLDALGLDADKLPPILDRSAEPAGLLTADAAARLGLRPGVPIAAGAADTAAAALGSQLTEPGTMQLTIGTGAQLVMPVAERPEPLPAHPVTHLYRAATDTGWYRMAAVLNGGLTLDWVRRALGAGWPELYAAAGVPPQADDPYFLPHVNGERTPYLDPSLRGAWTGLGPRHDRIHLLRAALEGVAFAVRDALDSLDPTGEIAGLHLAGGGTTDPQWRQMLADVLGRTLVPVEVPAASGLGAAVLGARATGLTDRFPSRDSFATSRNDPRSHRHDLYHDRHAAFRRKVRALRDSDSTTVGTYAGSAPHGAASASG